MKGKAEVTEVSQKSSKHKAEESQKSGALDIVKWLITFALIALAVVGNYIYSDTSVVIRAASVIALIAIAFGVAAMTTKGKAAISFAKEARMEIRKVVWPTRQETMQTTFIVLVVSVLTALILWGIDGIMVRLIAFVTGV